MNALAPRTDARPLPYSQLATQPATGKLALRTLRQITNTRNPAAAALDVWKMPSVQAEFGGNAQAFRAYVLEHAQIDVDLKALAAAGAHAALTQKWVSLGTGGMAKWDHNFDKFCQSERRNPPATVSIAQTQANRPSAPPAADVRAEADAMLARLGTQARWDASADIRAEFGDNFEAYAAYSRAETEGRVRIFDSKRLSGDATQLRPAPAAQPSPSPAAGSAIVSLSASEIAAIAAEVKALRAKWDASPSLQAWWSGDFSSYVNSERPAIRTDP